MEATLQISNDSFSLGRLQDSLRCSEDSFDHGSFIDMDPNLFSIRWIDLEPFDLNPVSCEFSVLVNPVEGHGDPVILQSKEWDDSHCRDSSPTLRIGSNKQKLALLRLSLKSPGMILRKYLCFLIPLYKKVKKFKLVSPRRVQSCGDSLKGSPRRSNALSETEIFINDAVLHCKKCNANEALGV
ncbi:hypothetical protein HPP92_002882 [Vanilla planifolia]|uniref:Uncharacterized protein n=1 Tax=Vanilla planifolia TaxID=51239 RepID=A0A835VIW8_VANPL|nr:hypothetical protein HPP92_002882 [Vanilla planifolia]